MRKVFSSRSVLLWITLMVLALAETWAAQEFSVTPVGFGVAGPTSSDGFFAVQYLSHALDAQAETAMAGGGFSVVGAVSPLSLPAALTGPELIRNGSFERDPSKFQPDGNGRMFLSAGDSNLEGWTVASGPVVWLSNKSADGELTADGDLFISLAVLASYGSVRQTITTVPGRRYRLTLSLGSHSNFSVPKAVQVCAGETARVFTFTQETVAGSQWRPFSFSFPATGPSTEITITGVRGGNYLPVDSVSVQEEVGPASPVQEDLIVNGSFELPCAALFKADSFGVVSLAPGDAAIPGWTITTAETIWSINGNNFGPKTPFGSFFVDLTGYHDTAPYGGVAQTIPTLAGESYQLSFALGTHESVGTYRGPLTLLASVAGTSQAFTFTPSGSGSQWQKFTMNFTAASAATPISLTGFSAAGGAYFGLDEVSVVRASTPPPTLKLSLTTPPPGASGPLRLTFDSELGASYSVESSDDLLTGSWVELPVIPLTGNGLPLQIDLPPASAAGHHFYRLRVER